MYALIQKSDNAILRVGPDYYDLSPEKPFYWTPCPPECTTAWTYNGSEFFPPVVPTPTPEEIIEQYTEAVQQRLDDFARTRGYDGILSACTYNADTIQKFQIEGQYCVEARGATWQQCYTILDAVLAGEIPMPTLEELFAQLPVLQWPN